MAVRLGSNAWASGEKPLASTDLNDTFDVVRYPTTITIDSILSAPQTDGVLRAVSASSKFKYISGIIKYYAGVNASSTISVTWKLAVTYEDSTTDTITLKTVSYDNSSGGSQLYYYSTEEINISLSKYATDVSFTIDISGSGAAGIENSNASDTSWTTSIDHYSGLGTTIILM